MRSFHLLYFIFFLSSSLNENIVIKSNVYVVHERICICTGISGKKKVVLRKYIKKLRPSSRRMLVLLFENQMYLESRRRCRCRCVPLNDISLLFFLCHRRSVIILFIGSFVYSFVLNDRRTLRFTWSPVTFAQFIIYFIRISWTTT